MTFCPCFFFTGDVERCMLPTDSIKIQLEKVLQWKICCEELDLHAYTLGPGIQLFCKADFISPKPVLLACTSVTP